MAATISSISAAVQTPAASTARTALSVRLGLHQSSLPGTVQSKPNLGCLLSFVQVMQ